jgi:hypothetical protein
MKKILILFGIIISMNCSAQKIGVSFGYTTKSYIPIDFYFASSSGLGLKISLSVDTKKNTEGENYSSTINWDAFPEDHKSEGSYLTPIDFGIGKFFDQFYVFGLIGFSNETLYRNCFDNFHILGENGNYYKLVEGNNDLNYGIEAGYFKSNINIGIIYTKYTGLGFKLGIYIGD